MKKEAKKIPGFPENQRSKNFNIPGSVANSDLMRSD